MTVLFLTLLDIDGNSMPSKQWKHPELGSFRLHNEFGGAEWQGIVELPAFSAFRFRGHRPFRGSKRISLRFCSNDDDFVPAKKLVRLAIRILQNQAKLAERIKTRFYKDILGIGPKSGMWWHNDRMAQELCGEVLTKRLKHASIESPDDLDLLLGEPSITIWDSETKPVAGISFGCAFEEEHGVEVITDGTKLLGLGYDGDASSWEAEAKKDTTDAALLKELNGEEIWSLYGSQSRAVQLAAIDRAAKQLDLVLKESKPARRKTMLHRLVQLLHAASESKSAKYEPLFVSCLENWEWLVKPKPADSYYDCESLLKLIGLGPKKRAMHLIEARDRLPAACFGIIADAGRKWMKASDFFETFSSYLNGKARKKSDEFLRDGCLRESLSRELSPLYSYETFSGGKNEKRRLDKRWLDLALKQNDEWLIVELASKGNQESLDFLTKEWESQKSKDPFCLFAIIESMVRSKHPRAKEIFLATVQRKGLRKTFDPDWQRWLYLLKDFPESVADEVKSLPEHKRCSKEAKKEIAYYLSIPYDKYFD